MGMGYLARSGSAHAMFHNKNGLILDNPNRKPTRRLTQFPQPKANSPSKDRGKGDRLTGNRPELTEHTSSTGLPNNGVTNIRP